MHYELQKSIVTFTRVANPFGFYIIFAGKKTTHFFSYYTLFLNDPRVKTDTLFLYGIDMIIYVTTFYYKTVHDFVAAKNDYVGDMGSYVIRKRARVL